MKTKLDKSITIKTPLKYECFTVVNLFFYTLMFVIFKTHENHYFIFYSFYLKLFFTITIIVTLNIKKKKKDKADRIMNNNIHYQPAVHRK